MMLKQEACLVAGEWITGSVWSQVEDPATGIVIGRVPALGAAETRRAIEAARLAMIDWRGQTAAQRGQVLRRIHALMLEHQEVLARLLTSEQGKPLDEARAEIAYAAGFLDWFAEEGRRIYGELIPAPSGDKRIMVMKQPVGVVGAITPWNFPSAMVTRKIAPALAAGCGVVLKPAPQTPFSALALGVIAQEAGLPPGLFNIITGPAEEIGAELTSSPVVRKISFTGSTAVGALLMAQAAPTIKKLSLELGGNAPFIVFDDADLDAAVQGAILSKFRNAGQTCVCTNRFYVQAGIYDAFLAKLAEAVAALRVGAGSEERTDIGPLIDQPAVSKVRSHVDDAVAKGARVLTGGRQLEGLFFEPTVLADVTREMIVNHEETFGPLAPVSGFDTEAEVVALANATEFGLAAYVYTRDNSRVWRMAEQIESGILGINTGLISTEVAPFGGIKRSGLGREGSRHGIDDYLELKYVCIGV
ncbi:MAG: succinate semialdehyde dehydrogenase [Bradyrhizobium sp.]|nr:succinate semialdehyde dehydrogenase [Bradyrhizobium sp.]